MVGFDAVQVAQALGARDWSGKPAGGPVRAVIDSRDVGAGDLFFGLSGDRHDGGDFAPAALRNGAWGVVVAGAAYAGATAAATPNQAVYVVADPIVALGASARAWRRALGATVVGVTGSTGKTTTKDLIAALAGQTRRVVATPENLNTEIGLPLVLLGAPQASELLVLEMGMRGVGQIADLVAIAEPDIGCIVNVGPVHLEQLGTVEAVAAAKAELVRDLPSGAGAVLPAGEPLLEPHRRDDLRTLTFGAGGDVRLVGDDRNAYKIATPAGEVQISAAFDSAHMVSNLLAAVACCVLADIAVGGSLDVNFSGLRGELVEVLDGVTIVNDCYNANPMSMRAALDDLARAGGRRLAVLGGMAELGDQSDRYHAEIARHASERGVELLLTVGDLARGYDGAFVGDSRHVDSPAEAAALVRELAAPGDTVLVKGSRSIGLEAVAERLLSAERPVA